ncbi:MAG: methyltransferase domain-containing protein [Bacteroidia bacterium]|nr:methyltransferase domain-containing protein [Bacteroidia bacterium]MBP7714961.1 methyltransferase domain-containing protein [Bacteroidia bacterium]MBP8668006.1 methyltransferase domain-containing protein [Bacteroidia bacterium]HQX71016.1 methyltransferase domain-containing protein [Bacteroidia bacterium]HRB54417.1 methyltransferase domain-containing protein [Bacteroidia bacterium]
MTSPGVFQFGIPVTSVIDSIKITEQEIAFYRITNIDALYSKLSSLKNDDDNVIDERIPYWAELWPSAIALAEYLCTRKLNNDMLIHEIGCGLALPSLVCGKMGYSVMMSDYVDAPLQFASANWRLNVKSEPTTILLDWRKIPDDIEKCDLLLAADVAYESRMFPAIVNAFKRLVKSGGRIVFTEPNRKFASGFFELIRHEFTNTTIQNREVIQNNHKHQIKIVEIEVE